jgi:hypothetical protein
MSPSHLRSSLHPMSLRCIVDAVEPSTVPNYQPFPFAQLCDLTDSKDYQYKDFIQECRVFIFTIDVIGLLM